MIYITGDTHCPFDISKLKPHHFPEGQIYLQKKIMSLYVVILELYGMICY